MRYKRTISTVVVVVAAFVTGCQSTNQGSKTYKSSQTQRAQSVQYGTVLAVADVTIAPDSTAGGAVGGAVVGGILGHAITGRSSSSTRRVGATLGAVGGAAAGSAAARTGGTKPGVEIEVELDDGRVMVIVQEKDDEYAVGDKVRVLTLSDRSMRVRQ
jgi:outer membrane lipoprotein SlyB